MKNTLGYVATTVIAVAAGFVAGVLFAPQSGQRTRRQLAEQAKERLKAAESQLDAVEEQLAELNDRVRETGQELSGKLRKAAQDVVDQHVPDLAEGIQEWSEGGEQEIVKDLRNITRK